MPLPKFTTLNLRRSFAKMASGDAGSLSSFLLCEHCNKLLGEKAYKEHHRLYFQRGEWLKVQHMDHAEDSLASSPLSLGSDPPSNGHNNTEVNDIALEEESDDSRGSSMIDLDSNSPCSVCSDDNSEEIASTYELKLYCTRLVE